MRRIVRFRAKSWLPFLLVAVSLGCSAEAETPRTDHSRSKECRLGELEARDHVSARCVFYDVHGSNLAGIPAQLQFGVRDGGAWWAALTRLNVSWSFRYIGPTPCRLTSPSVRLTLEYVLPRWKPPGRVDPADVAEWNRYLERVWEHERGHARNGLAAVRDVQSALTRLPAAPDCRRLESEAHATARRVVDRWKRTDVAYDEATDHGEATGAVLNP